MNDDPKDRPTYRPGGAYERMSLNLDDHLRRERAKIEPARTLEELCNRIAGPVIRDPTDDGQ